MTILQKKLIRLARKSGACSRVSELEACKTERELVALMYRYWDFVCENNFPPKALLIAYKDIVRPFGVYVDDPDVQIAGVAKVALFDSTATAVADGFKSQIIYAARGAKITVEASGHALVVVEACGFSEVYINTSEKAAVIVTLRDHAALQYNRPDNLKIINHATV